MNSSAFLIELTAAALQSAAFAGVCVVLWLLCGRQSAARASVCGRLIIVVTLGMMFVGFGAAWQRCRVQGDAVVAAEVIQTDLPLPEAAPAGESPSMLTPLPDHSAVTDAPVDAGMAPETARQWRLSPSLATLLIRVWVAGAFIISIRWAIALILRRRLVHGADVVTDPSWLDLMKSLTTGMKPPRLLRHRGSTVPCAWGIFRR